MINIADLVDPNDTKGRTWREINNATLHKFKIGDLVELKNGCRVLISRLYRDCDGTPLYLLKFGSGSTGGFDDTDMKLIKRANES